MIHRRRLALRRPRPELLGLSTLDTVTCALAGAIVLMMFMAFLTVPGAQVVLTDVRRIWEAGVALGQGEEAAQAAEAAAAAAAPSVDVRNIAVLFIDMTAKVRLTATVKQYCDFGPPLYALQSAEGHLSGTDESHALVIWAERPHPECTDFKIKAEYHPMVSATVALGCEVTLVSGAHYDTRQYSSCPTTFDLYAARDQVFRLERLQP